MIVRVRERGEGLDEPEFKILVHCEGQELEMSARTWQQLRYRLNDVARTYAGLKGFHVSGEQDRIDFKNGEELWMYWSDDLLHWRQWESLIPDPSQKTAVIIIENEWYMIPKADLKMALKHASTMRAEIAARLHVPIDEMRCVSVDEPVDPMENIQMIPHSVWRVTFEAPDWWEPVMIRIKVGNTTYRRAIMKRQSLSLLEE
jgi:hypothetical protein